MPWGAFRLRKLGVPITIIAMIYTVIALFFSSWSAFSTVDAANMNWSCLIFGGAIIFSMIFWLLHGRKVYKDRSTSTLPCNRHNSPVDLGSSNIAVIACLQVSIEPHLWRDSIRDASRDSTDLLEHSEATSSSFGSSGGDIEIERKYRSRCSGVPVEEVLRRVAKLSVTTIDSENEALALLEIERLALAETWGTMTQEFGIGIY
ncbi:hypothetical protein EYC80_001577 [Monilinia laxa]|uniref:Uncharacterized protein n=1 Tax=Monilinia laxa TaxID=61186 RepID=A0A5N6K644_MONLA|nr:hypothetical protein EYC80_001577 [Monilinia laxa]